MLLVYPCRYTQGRTFEHLLRHPSFSYINYVVNHTGCVYATNTNDISYISVCVLFALLKKATK